MKYRSLSPQRAKYGRSCTADSEADEMQELSPAAWKQKKTEETENMILQERKASALCTTVQTSLKRKAITSMKTLTVTNDTAQGVEREQEAHGAGVKSLLSP